MALRIAWNFSAPVTKRDRIAAEFQAAEPAEIVSEQGWNGTAAAAQPLIVV
jgi:hypothetical protein